MTEPIHVYFIGAQNDGVKMTSGYLMSISHLMPRRQGRAKEQQTNPPPPPPEPLSLLPSSALLLTSLPFPFHPRCYVPFPVAHVYNLCWCERTGHSTVLLSPLGQEAGPCTGDCHITSTLANSGGECILSIEGSLSLFHSTKGKIKSLYWPGTPNPKI